MVTCCRGRTTSFIEQPEPKSISRACAEYFLLWVHTSRARLTVRLLEAAYSIRVPVQRHHPQAVVYMYYTDGLEFVRWWEEIETGYDNNNSERIRMYCTSNNKCDNDTIISFKQPFCLSLLSSHASLARH